MATRLGGTTPFQPYLSHLSKLCAFGQHIGFAVRWANSGVSQRRLLHWEGLTQCNGQDKCAPDPVSLLHALNAFRFASAQYPPYSKGKEQACRAAIHQTSADLDVQGSANGTTNADELDMTWLQFSMSRIVDRARRPNHRNSPWRAVRLLRVDSICLLFRIVLGRRIVNIGGSHWRGCLDRIHNLSEGL